MTGNSIGARIWFTEMSLTKGSERARVLLERSLFSFVFEILWRSALLTLPLALVQYLFHPKFFDINDIWIIFAAFLVMHTLFILFGLLYASARYRKYPKQ